MDTTLNRIKSSAALSLNINTVLRNLFFPYYLMSVSLAIYFLNAGVSRVIVLLSLLASTITFNFTLEHLIPFFKNGYKKPYLRDFGLVLLNIAMTAQIGDFLMLLALATLSNYFAGHGLLPTEHMGPFAVQVLLAFVLVELVRYWTHYAQHKVAFLWKLHAVHHSVPEVYSLTNYYTHPVDYLLRNILSFPVLALMGFSYEVISVVAVLSTVGMFAHSGADYNCSIFNYIFSTNQMHRWHHSAEHTETDTNFGASLMIWDQVFGTYHNPPDREAPVQFGLQEDHPYTPSGFFEILTYPFLKKTLKKD
jgi:ornithine lipid hydroxylase